MMTTRRYRKIKTPVSKRKQRRTRRKRGVKGGTLSKCIEDCNKHKNEYKMTLTQCIENCNKLWPANPLAGLPTKENPTPNGWYMTRDEDTMYGVTYVIHKLHNVMEPAKSVSFLEIPKHDKTTIDLLTEFKKPEFDLPILGYISLGGYVLSIVEDKLMWKRGATLNPYVHGEEPTD